MKIADLKSSLMSVSFVMNKDSKILGEGPVSLPHKIFFYLLTAFNIFFLSYVLTVGYYNRLSLDDYAYLGAMRDNGFLSPFTYWYSHWQGRFGPQFLLNFVFLVYDVTSNLLFYPILLSSLFAYSIYQILNYYFSLPKRVLLNYSILLFAALLLTGFELSTFFWVNASTMYFGGMLFALLGIVFILKENQSYFRYVVVAICFLYAGSSSEHVGILACFLLFSASFISFYKLDWNFRNFIANPTNKRLLVALFFCSVAFIIMILAPGNKIRIAASAQVNDPILLLKKTYKATMFVCGHLFYKLPYFITFIPPFLLFGSFLKPSKTHNLSVGFVLVICAIAILSLIYTGNLPMAYTHNGAGPLRAYVYITFSVVCFLFLICFYIGRHYRSRLKYLVVVSILSLAILFVMLFYTFYMELQETVLIPPQDT